MMSWNPNFALLWLPLMQPSQKQLQNFGPNEVLSTSLKFRHDADLQIKINNISNFELQPQCPAGYPCCMRQQYTALITFTSLLPNALSCLQAAFTRRASGNFRSRKILCFLPVINVRSLTTRASTRFRVMASPYKTSRSH
jgi:hypothetical protein